ncbi:microcephalin-like isoform x1 [Phytophthora cinnamomi]|uniref:microcephalin-like isoform x1 n=1 Tax=Phytophthora cinnamomi TaxID=4785 RepID=UPI00355A4B0A|nr:microcephalin-like isoform x1 [Phytophthora cinnamomi]
MVAAVSISLSAGPRTARMTTRTAPRGAAGSVSVSAASSSSSSRTAASSTSSAPRRRPRSAATAGPLKGVVAMVDVRVGADAQIDCSDVVARKLRELGASTVKRVTPKLTHMVLSHFTPAWKTKIAKWQAGGGSMAAAATRYELKIVSQLWVNACYVSKKRMDERPFFPVSQQSAAEPAAAPAAAKPKLKRRQSLGADAPKAVGEAAEAQGADSATKTTNTKKTDAEGTKASATNVAPPSTPPPKINKALNGARRKRRAHSMEPMTSDAILKMLGTAEPPVPEVIVLSTPTQPIRTKSVSSSAKRRKTLNGPPTQQDEDEITASQASGIVAESESENEQDEEADAHRNEVIVIQDSQASQPSPAPFERKQKSPGALTDADTEPSSIQSDSRGDEKCYFQSRDEIKNTKPCCSKLHIGSDNSHISGCSKRYLEADNTHIIG